MTPHFCLTLCGRRPAASNSATAIAIRHSLLKNKTSRLHAVGLTVFLSEKGVWGKNSLFFSKKKEFFPHKASLTPSLTL